MKLYYHPVSTTSRPILQFCADHDIAYEGEVVDLMSGAHHQEPFISINPNRLVPVLDDDGFILSESSAILKYLAEKYDSPSYPKDLRARARVNEAMDWFNSNFYREFGYNLVYPQVFPHHVRSSDESNRSTMEWGKSKATACLNVLDTHMLGANKRYLCGDDVTVGDYFGAAILSIGEWVGAEYSRYPNISGWLDRMKSRSSWAKVNEAHDGFVAMLKAKRADFVSIN